MPYRGLIQPTVLSDSSIANASAWWDDFVVREGDYEERDQALLAEWMKTIMLKEGFPFTCVLCATVKRVNLYRKTDLLTEKWFACRLRVPGFQ